MASVLITGMTAPQCSVRTIERSKSFAGVLYDFLKSNGATVEVSTPSVDFDERYLNKFDKVLVGVSPVLSLSSNYAYGALSTIAAAENLDSDSLTLFIDSPDPAAVRLNLLAVAKSPGALFKPFYSNRKEYRQTIEDKTVSARVEKALDRLFLPSLRPALYPSLPFVEPEKIQDLLQGTAFERLTGVNLDFAYLDREEGAPVESNVWAVDDDKSRWFTKVRESLKKEYVLMKRNKGANDDDVDSVISSSIGSIISPGKNGFPWWSYRYAQSLRRCVPVITEWRDSSALGPSWGVIGPTLEEVSAQDRYQIAVDQRNTYLNATWRGASTIKSTLESIGIDLHDKAPI